MSLDVLYVCTGNVCRSPMAERLLRGAVAGSAGVRAHSAGVGALVGQPMDAASAAALLERGVSPEGHRAQQVTGALVEHADLVLTAERAHRDQILNEVAGASRYTFTMREFARLSRHVHGDDPHAVIARMAALRGVDGGVPLEMDDIADPFRQSLDKARLVAGWIADTVGITVAALHLPRARRPSPHPIQTTGAAEPRRPRPTRSAS